MTAKEKKQLIITAILIAVFIVLWGRVLVMKKKAAAKAKQTLSPITVSDLSQTQPPPLIQKMIEEGEGVALGKDPFYKIPLSSGSVSIESLTVEGIAWDETTPSAIINGKLVFQGERLPGDIEVVEIRKDGVVLRQGDEEVVLPLLKGDGGS